MHVVMCFLKMSLMLPQLVQTEHTHNFSEGETLFVNSAQVVIDHVQQQCKAINVKAYMRCSRGGFCDNNDAALPGIEYEQNRAQVLPVGMLQGEVHQQHRCLQLLDLFTTTDNF